MQKLTSLRIVLSQDSWKVLWKVPLKLLGRFLEGSLPLLGRFPEYSEVQIACHRNVFGAIKRNHLSDIAVRPEHTTTKETFITVEEM